MSSHRVLSTTGQVALHLLQLAAEALDSVPALKNLAVDALRIIELVKGFRSNQDKWQNFAEYICDATASVIRSLLSVPEEQEQARSNLRKLKTGLEGIARCIESEQALPRYKRLMNSMRDPDMISDLKAQLDNSLSLFQLNASITTMIDIHKTFAALISQENKLANIAQNTSHLMAGTEFISREAAFLSTTVTLDKLRRIQGSSWDSAKLCLHGTRVELVDGILAQIEDLAKPKRLGNVKGASILFLTGVAGAGKTTIAHTVAQRCADRGQLVSSFFFDRNVDGRNTAVALFSTIASDLSRLDNCLAQRITTAVRKDPSLSFASFYQQFNQLVKEPCKGLAILGPKVFVLDALDQVDESSLLLHILGRDVHKLPSNFCFFVTSRSWPELNHLRYYAHVNMIELNITTSENHADVEKFIDHELGLLARYRNFEDGWPGEALRAQFVAKAGGLFQWVSIVCGYLRRRNDPTEELKQLVAMHGPTDVAVETQMDALYMSILDRCDWTDQSFVNEYYKLLGVTLALKAPLTISTIKQLSNRELRVPKSENLPQANTTNPISSNSTIWSNNQHSSSNSISDHEPYSLLLKNRDFASDYTLQMLSPILTGTSKSEHDTQPLQLLHQSLRDFLTARFKLPQCTNLQISEKRTSGDLAFFCLETLNSELTNTFPSSGHLFEQRTMLSDLPLVGDEVPSEAMWYACRFWMEHLKDAAEHTEMQIARHGGRYSRISSELEPLGFLKDRTGYTKKHLMHFLENNLLVWLEIMATRGELRPLVGFRGCVMDALGSDMKTMQPTFEKYGKACLVLSDYFAGKGQTEDSLQMLEESLCWSARPFSNGGLVFCSFKVSNFERNYHDVPQPPQYLYRQLFGARQATHTHAELAVGLERLSLRLHFLGRHQEAINTINESVTLWRRLVMNRPNVYEAELSRALAVCFRHYSRLEIIEVHAVHPLAGGNENIWRNQVGNSRADMCRRMPLLLHATEAGSCLGEDELAPCAADLSLVLQKLSGRLVKLDLHAEALAILYEAALCRRPSQDQMMNLYTVLSNLSTTLEFQSKADLPWLCGHPTQDTRSMIDRLEGGGASANSMSQDSGVGQK